MQPFTHCFYSEHAEKTPQHFNASLFTVSVAVIGSFLTIDAQIGRVLKRGVLQNTWPSLQAHNPLPSVGLHAGYKIFYTQTIRGQGFHLNLRCIGGGVPL